MAAWICALLIMENTKVSVYGSGLTHVLDSSYVAVYGEESNVIAKDKSIVNYHKGSVEAHDSAIIIDESPNIENQTSHAQRILRP